MKNNEFEVLEPLVYYLTEEEVQDVAEQEIDRKMTSGEIDELRSRVSEEMLWVLQEAIREVADFTKLKRRRIGKKKINPRYEISWKNENAYQNDLILACAFKDEDDARAYVRECHDSPGDEYKIEKVDGESRQIIVHHKNSLNGGDGFHMDVHEVPKTLQNHQDLEF